MLGTLESVKQTHKAILFENFNGWQKNTLSLSQLLNGSYDDADAKKDYISRLEVHSFEEFLEKFAPKIFENSQRVIVTDDDGREVEKFTFNYSLDDSKGGGAPISLDDHAYYKMLASMYDQKRNSGQSNRDFDSSKLKEILTPKSEEKESNRLRKNAELLMMQYTEAVNRKENANVYANQIIDWRRKVAEKRRSSAVTNLGMRISGINNQIKFLEEKENENKALPPGNEDAEVSRGVLDFDADGKPIIKALPASTADTQVNSANLLTVGNSIKMLKSAVESDIDDDDNSFTKKMIIANYLPTSEDESFALTPAGVSQKLTELKNLRDDLEDMYIQAQSSFIKVLKQIVTRFLGVKVFFDHATVKGELPKNQGLLVTNCSVGDLVNDEKIKAAFEEFIINQGNETQNNRLWLGILPHVICGNDNPDEQEDAAAVNPFAAQNPFDIDINSAGGAKKFIETTTLAEAKQLLSIMQKAGILTVFNAAVANDMPLTFGGVTKKVIDDCKSKLAEIGIDFAHAVFAYPNFTIIRNALVPIDNREDAQTIDVGSVYIDAAYVAAGLIVASQQPEFLIQNGFKGRVDRQSVCVRLNLEDGEITSKLLTHFNRELSTSWSKDIIDTISADRFGFVFSGDSKFDRESQKYLENSYIFSARTMAKQDDGTFRPIYKTLTNDFILSYLKTIAPKISKADFNNFLTKDVREWKNQTKRGEKDRIINCVLQQDDDVQKSNEGAGKLRVILGGGDMLLDVELENN